MLRIALLFVYFTHLFLSGNIHAKGDPLGHSAPSSSSLQVSATGCSDPLCKTPPPPATLDTGGGVDPNGRP
jgi:hypothetical protein